MYHSIPKPPIPPPPGQSPGIWLALSSVQWGIWPKMRPARWGIWLSCQNVCQRSETKGFRNSLIQHVHRVHGSLLLPFHVGFSVVVLLNKKFVVAENFAELVSKGKRFCLYSFISWVHGVTEAACHWRVISQINIHIFKASLFFGDRLCLHILFVEWVFFHK